MARPRRRHVVSLSNEGYAASLERGMICIALEDAEARVEDSVRVIDGSGEDYSYPTRRFADIGLPRKIARALGTLA